MSQSNTPDVMTADEVVAFLRLDRKTVYEAPGARALARGGRGRRDGRRQDGTVSRSGSCLVLQDRTAPDRVHGRDATTRPWSPDGTQEVPADRGGPGDPDRSE